MIYGYLYKFRFGEGLNSYVAHGKKTGADKTQDEDTTNATQQPKTQARAQQHGPSAAAWPERSSMARAPRNGPSAATWPERRDMARAQRAPQKRARVALQLKQRRGHRLDIARAHALTG